MALQDVERQPGFFHRQNKQNRKFIIGTRELIERGGRVVKLFIDKCVVRNLFLYGSKVLRI
jgi:hypothetical protein